MSDDAVSELTKNPETKAKLSAFRAVIENLQAKQIDLPAKIAAQTERMAAAEELANRIQGKVSLIIKQDQKVGLDTEDIKARRDFGLQFQQVALDYLKECSVEKLMLKGEARGILDELKAIEKLHQNAITHEQTMKNLQEQQDEIRRQQGREPEEETKPKKRKRKAKKISTEFSNSEVNKKIL